VSGSSFLLQAGEVIVETHVQTAERPSISRAIESDLEGYLDAIAGATGIFREAVDAYLHTGPDGGCWRQARSIAEHMRTLDDMQQRLETGVRPQSTLGDLVGEMIDPLTGVGRLLKDMKRQVTGFAIESGFSGPGRCVPGYLVEGMQELADDVCAAVDALIESYRPSMLWWEQPSSVAETRVLPGTKARPTVFRCNCSRRSSAMRRWNSRCSYRWRNSSRKSTVWRTRQRASTRRCEPAARSLCPLPVQEILTDSSTACADRAARLARQRAGRIVSRFVRQAPGTTLPGFRLPSEKRLIVLRSKMAQAV
jgi:hypothetical protein